MSGATHPFLTLMQLAILCAIVRAHTAFGAEFAPEQIDYFEKRVRPVLVQRCVKCHGADKQRNGLRVDSRQRLLQGGDRGPALVPGNARASLLIRAVERSHDHLQMPPDGELATGDVERLREWVRMGAPWPGEPNGDHDRQHGQEVSGHWAFRPVGRPSVPGVIDSDWPQSDVDGFVLAQLESAGLKPSPPADRATLVRRAYVDLTGLPPTYAQIQEFIQDDQPQAFERLVDKLLASRQYGQRWARHWLDVARYADTKGYLDGGQMRYAFAYTYRDYVVRAFCEDVPFDQFVMDQLSADRLGYSADERWRMAAMGFLTVGRRFNHDMHDILDDRIDVISRGLMGLTVSCARCHDHKYDPIPTADYYSLYGVLASSYEPQHPDLPLLEEMPDDAETREYVEQLAKRNRDYQEKFTQLRDTIQHELRAFAGDYLVYLVQESPRHREGPQNPLKTPRTILRGPSAYGFGAIRRWRRYVNDRDESDAVFGIWQRMFNADTAAFADALAEHLSTASQANPVLKQAIQNSAPRSMASLARCYGEVLEHVYGRWTALRESNPEATKFDDPALEQLRRVLYDDDSPATMTAEEAIDCYHLDEHTDLRNTSGKIEEASVERKGVPARAMVLRDRAPPHEPVIFVRGQPNRPGRPVARGVPRLLAGLCAPDTITEGSGRLELAKTIVDPRNPLTARVFVNRVWQWHLGKPLVATTSDFGTRSQPPTHPELLDYLAEWFVHNGWSLKRLHRLIVLSSVYQQSSTDRPECSAIDPENRLLWRYNRQRSQWEVVRDSLLMASGRLEERFGGPPIEDSTDDPQSTTRTIYLLVDRQHVSPFARDFDFASPDFTSPPRATTIVPQQQLFFLNSPFVMAQAKALGELALASAAASDEQRVAYLFRRVLGRDPYTRSDAKSHDSELTAALRYVHRAGADGEETTSDTPKADGEGDATAHLGVWSKLAHALLQSNEFIYVE